MARLSADSDSSDEFEGYQPLRAISEVSEFRNWAVTVQTAPAKVLRPKSVQEVLKVLEKVGEGVGVWGRACTALGAISPLAASNVPADERAT